VSLVTGGLGVGALVTMGLGVGFGAVPSGPAPAFGPTVYGGGGGGGGDWGEDEDEAEGAYEGQDAEFLGDEAQLAGDAAEPEREPPHLEALPDTEELSWADRLAVLIRRWIHETRGVPHGPTIRAAGAEDAGKRVEQWTTGDLITAGAEDAGKVHEDWGAPEEFPAGGATDGGKLEEKWQEDPDERPPRR
jgi:hypothetical protein